jgi:hypothetical protein
MSIFPFHSTLLYRLIFELGLLGQCTYASFGLLRFFGAPHDLHYYMPTWLYLVLLLLPLSLMWLIISPYILTEYTILESCASIQYNVVELVWAHVRQAFELRLLILGTISGLYGDHGVQTARQAFAHFSPKLSDGHLLVTRAQLRVGLKQWGLFLNDRELTIIEEAIDPHHRGTFTFSEFCKSFFLDPTVGAYMQQRKQQHEVAIEEQVRYEEQLRQMLLEEIEQERREWKKKRAAAAVKTHQKQQQSEKSQQMKEHQPEAAAKSQQPEQSPSPPKIEQN